VEGEKDVQGTKSPIGRENNDRGKPSYAGLASMQNHDRKEGGKDPSINPHLSTKI